MTSRERIVMDKLILERDAAQDRALRYHEAAMAAAEKAKRAKAALAKKQRVWRCVYCGRRAPQGWQTCHRHRDLLALDPVYAMVSSKAAA